MKVVWLAAALVATAVPAMAQDAPVGVMPSAEERALLPLFDQATQARLRGDYDGELAIAEKAIARLSRPTPFRSWINCIYGVRVVDSDKEKARPAIEECHAAFPENPTAKMAYGRLLIADGAKERGYRLVIEAIRGEPRWTDGCDTTAAGDLRTELRVMSYDHRLDELRAELIEVLVGTACGNEDPAFYSGLMRDVIAKRIARGEIEKARAGIAAVLDPDDILKMLVDRRYAPIWSDIERWTGGNLEAQRVALVHKVRQGHDAAPSIASATRLSYALNLTGGRDEAILLLAQALADPAMATPDLYDEGTAAVRVADLRNEGGEKREAVVTAPLRKLLAQGDLAKTPSLWNVVPNLARWMIIYGKPGEALALLDRYVSRGANLDSPEAQGYFTALRGCAQLRGGDPAGQSVLRDVIRDFAGNKGAVRIAASCGNDRAALRSTVLALMEDEQERSALLLDLVRIRALGANGRAMPSYERVAFVALLAEPAFAKRLDELARDPGPGYRAALSRWRKR